MKGHPFISPRSSPRLKQFLFIFYLLRIEGRLQFEGITVHMIIA